ncbi:hypothetical protein BP6252_08323 [Coleophoma cylindrospora]|uniref:Uncharacterized protein n=1 Tax=Coleophoma cylindrospora TaxID=1849047 RepID=A0A3D8R5J7_9HELO|nr:hypothetical protein BP6252_08323 [Coleophoma cylindrospora]
MTKSLKTPGKRDNRQRRSADRTTSSYGQRNLGSPKLKLKRCRVAANHQRPLSDGYNHDKDHSRGQHTPGKSSSIPEGDNHADHGCQSVQKSTDEIERKHSNGKEATKEEQKKPGGFVQGFTESGQHDRSAIQERSAERTRRLKERPTSTSGLDFVIWDEDSGDLSDSLAPSSKDKAAAPSRYFRDNNTNYAAMHSTNTISTRGLAVPVSRRKNSSSDGEPAANCSIRYNGPLNPKYRHLGKASRSRPKRLAKIVKPYICV